MNVDLLIDEVIAREGGYSIIRPTGAAPTRWGVTEAVARAHGYRGDMRAYPRAGRGGGLPPHLLAPARLRHGRRACAPARRRAVRHRRQHGSGGRRRLSPARAERAQPRRLRLSGPAVDRRVGAATLAALQAFLARRGPGARRCCSRRSRRSRASATSASPSSARPTRPSSTAGSPTGSAEVPHGCQPPSTSRRTCHGPHRSRHRPDRQAARQDHPRPGGARPRQARTHQGQGSQEMQAIERRWPRSLPRPIQPDPWTSRARPSFPLRHVRAAALVDPDGPDRRCQPRPWRWASPAA
jgi:hypothetical protein